MGIGDDPVTPHPTADHTATPLKRLAGQRFTVHDTADFKH